MSTPTLENLYGQPLKQGYSYRKKTSTNRYSALKGRSRYRLRDVWSAHTFTVNYDMSEDQFYGFQKFWSEQLNNGANWFYAHLMMDYEITYVQNVERYLVHATGPYQASSKPNGYWSVSFEVESTAGIFFDETLCDVIWAGRITNLPPDDIWAGDIDNLPIDIIEPCEWVIQ